MGIDGDANMRARKCEFEGKEQENGRRCDERELVATGGVLVVALCYCPWRQIAPNTTRLTVS